MDRAASSISDGDLVDALIHGSVFFIVLPRLLSFAKLMYPVPSNTGASCRYMRSVPQSARRLPFMAWAHITVDLMPCHSPSTCSIRCSVHSVCGLIHVGRWLGQNSKQSKLSRQLTDVQIRMRLKVSGDKFEIRQSYLPALFPHIVSPLIESGAVCDFYFLHLVIGI
jgi:replication factor C subunit 1